MKFKRSKKLITYRKWRRKMGYGSLLWRGHSWALNLCTMGHGLELWNMMGQGLK